MASEPRKILLAFYDQSLLSPDLMCLYCARASWNKSTARCPADKRQDCLIFAGDMVNLLAKPVSACTGRSMGANQGPHF